MTYSDLFCPLPLVIFIFCWFCYTSELKRHRFFFFFPSSSLPQCCLSILFKLSTLFPMCCFSDSCKLNCPSSFSVPFSSSSSLYCCLSLSLSLSSPSSSPPCPSFPALVNQRDPCLLASPFLHPFLLPYRFPLRHVPPLLLL